MDRLYDGVVVEVTDSHVTFRDTKTGNLVIADRHDGDGAEEIEVGDRIVLWLVDDPARSRS